MPTSHTHEATNGHRTTSHQKPRRPQAKRTLWSSATHQAKSALASVDMPAVIRKYPLPALAVASGAGVIIGVTVGSKLVRMLVGSVGMYTVSELLRRYAKTALDEMKATELNDESPIEVS